MEFCPVYICLSKFFTKVLQANFLAVTLIQLTVQMVCLYYAVEVGVLRFIGFYPLSLANINFYSNQMIMYETNENKEMDQFYSMTLHAWSTSSYVPRACPIFCGSQSQGEATYVAVMRVQMLMRIHVVSIGILFTLHIKSCITVNYHFYLKVQPIL